MMSIPEKDFSLLLNAIPGAYLVLTPDLHIASVSDLFLDYVQGERNHLLNKSIADVYTSFKQKPGICFIEKLHDSLHFVLKHARAHPGENIYTAVSNSVFQFYNKPILDASHKVKYIIHHLVKTNASYNVPESSELVKEIIQPAEYSKLQAEKTPLSNLETYRAMINNSTDITVLMNEKFQILYKSPSCERTTGYTKDDVTDKTLLDVIHPDDLEGLKEKLNESIRSPEKRVALFYREMHKKGHYMWIEGSVVNLLHDKNLQSLLLNFRDVTERINIENKLKEGEEHYRNTLDNMIEGVQILDFDWKYVYLNDAAIKQARMAKEELIGESILKKFPGIKGTELYHSFKKCYEEREVVQFENRFVYGDGSVAWYELSIQPIPEGVFVLSVDITQRKIAEETLHEESLRLQTISDSLPGIIIFQFVYDEKGVGKYTYLSKGVKKLTGFSADAVIEDPSILDSMVVEEDRKILLEAEKKSYRDLSLFNVEVRFKSANDGLRWINFISTPSINHRSQVIWNGFLIDITDRKKIEQVAKQLNAELEERVEQRTAQLKKSNEEMEAFSYSVSHDLRAPLRGIIGFTNILEEEYGEKLDEEAKRITGIIKSNTVKMSTLIDDLLTFSRVGRHQVEKALINTNELVEQVIAGLDLKSKKDKIKWKIPLLDEAYGDIGAIRQVWINLISNAIKYSSLKPEQRIEIGSYQLKNQIVFFVKDNGVGFDNKYVQKLFKVFQRLHSNTEFEGTGVGLAIVEKIISKHNGKVWATGVINEGACFYFSLPMVSIIANKN